MNYLLLIYEDEKALHDRDGRTITTDGPFAETKEQLGGFYLVSAKDLDESISRDSTKSCFSRGPRRWSHSIMPSRSRRRTARTKGSACSVRWPMTSMDTARSTLHVPISAET